MGSAPKQSRTRLPRRPWRLLLGTVLVLGFASVLLVRAYAAGSFTADRDGQPGTAGRGSVPAQVLAGGPIVDTTRSIPASYRLPAKTIALTFDDGPSPDWTPAVLAVLRKYHVKGTFFLIGEQVARYPDVAKAVVTDGNEVGIHTFTHPDLSHLTDWWRGFEYSQSQLVIAAATGRTTSLLRPPYSSVPSALDADTWEVTRNAGRHGFLAVYTDLNSHDWTGRDIEAMLNSAAPPVGSDSDTSYGPIVLWHDAGGDRSRTVAALDRYIPMMQARGYRFTTVSEGLGLSLHADRAAVTPGGAGLPRPVADNIAASGSERWRGAVAMWVVRFADDVFALLWWLFLAVGALTLARTVLLFAFAGHHAARRRSARWSWGPPITDPVTVVVPAYNERAGIGPAVRSLACGDYPTIEVIVVDDGSTDDTAGIVEALGLPNVRVVRTPNRGKPSALNTGARLASHDLIVMVDGDTVFEPDSIRRLVQPFGDPTIGAVSGNVKVGNRSNIVARWQHIEYVIGFNLDRRMYDTLRCMPTIPGAIGAFRRVALADVGGVSDETLAEDTDLTMALCRAGWRVVYEESAIAWTEAPATLGQLWKQRYRWSYGTMQALWKHRGAIRDRTAFGLLGIPLLALFGVLLPLLAPLLDMIALYSLIFFDARGTALAWLAMLGVQAFTAVVAFRLDRESLGPLLALPLQQFVYRQAMYMVIIQSLSTALTGARLRWHKLRRVGLLAPGTPVGSVPVQAARTSAVRRVPGSRGVRTPAAGYRAQ